MIYKIEKKNNRIRKTRVASGRQFQEADIESFLISPYTDESEGVYLDEDIFDEKLLFLQNQVHLSLVLKHSRSQRIPDILALDHNGAVVIIELKKNKAGIEASTQSLQYISLLNGLTYEELFKLTNQTENQKSFEDEIENIILDKKISNFRIILVAQEFHPSVLSLGEWFGEQGIGFKCIQYNTFALDAKKDENFIFFKTIFNTYQKGSYRLLLKDDLKPISQTGIYWYNVALGGKHVDSKWKILLDKQFITAGFQGKEGDKGEKLLKSYLKKGMKLIAYASGIGAIGVAKITEDPHKTYSLATIGSDLDYFDGGHLHRIQVSWLAGVQDLNDAIPASRIKGRFKIPTPVQTSCVIRNQEHAKNLLEYLLENAKL